MAKVACYNPKGEKRMKEPVDARECVENLGFTMDKGELKELKEKGVNVEPIIEDKKEKKEDKKEDKKKKEKK